MYNVKYHCMNCDHSFLKEIPKGTLAPQCTTCPNCGCATGKKNQWGYSRVTFPTMPRFPYHPPWDERKRSRYGWEDYYTGRYQGY